MRHFLYLFIGILVISSCSTTAEVDPNASRMKIAFGSCNHQYEEQPMWKVIKKNNPNLFIWTGDIIYSDTEDMSKMKADYAQQKTNPDYAKFKSVVPVIGIWDDHDYGKNNAGKEYSKKDSSRMLLFDFLDVPAESDARKHEGAYQKYEYERGDLKVKVLLLDTRYFRDSIGASQATILGSEQWRWLINELSFNTADVHLIISGVQVLPNDHQFEKWGNFPTDRERLIQILDRLNVNYPILISGDRHIGEVSYLDLPSGKGRVMEITSSGLTHYYENFTSEENVLRVGQVVAELNFGIIDIEKENGQIYFDADIRNKKNQIKATINESYNPARAKK